MNTYLRIIGKTNYILFLAFLFSATFASELFRFFGTLWFISWLLEFRFLKKENLTYDKFLWPLVGFVALWIFQAIALLWSDNITSGINTLNKQLYFIGFFLVGLFGVNKQYSLNNCFTSILLGAITSSIVYFFVIFYVTNWQHYFTDPYGEYQLIFPWHQYASYSSFLKHRLYHGTQLIIAIIATGFLYHNWKNKWGQTYAILLSIGSLFILISTLLFTGSRANLLALFILILAYLIFRFWKYRYIIAIILSSFTFITLCIVMFHPRMQNITKQDIENISKPETNYRKNSEPRLYIWNTAIRHIDQYILFGKGTGSSRDFLVTLYKTNHAPNLFLERRYNAHNQYLETTIETGIIGLLLLLTSFLSLLYVSQRKTRVFATYFLLLILWNMLTESMLGRTDGILTICIMNILFVIMNRLEAKNNNNLDT